ncbi:hypothetical protein BDF22DRAFT_184454 [Syncephalis plumigaleata]|nr:hypothetical protein BDF22DRAFT_184454 [Syncephalis plumigaleata]
MCVRVRVHVCLGLLLAVENKGQTALAAVLTVKVSSHEDTGAALLVGALTTKTGNLTVLIDLVVLENSKLNLLVLVLDLLWCGVAVEIAHMYISSSNVVGNASSSSNSSSSNTLYNKITK